MGYHEILPSADLRPWVDRYWVRSASVSPVSLTVLPDGAADLILDFSGTGGRLSAAFAVGTMTRPLVLHEESMPELFGIRFRPGRAAAFFGLPLALITDRGEPLRDLAVTPLSNLADRFAATDNGSRIPHVERLLRERLHNASPDHRVTAAVAAFLRTSGRLSVAGAAAVAGVTRQHLGRLFAAHVGVSPKTFARVTRFRRALALGRRQPWSDVAAHLGYADQSHLIADFREFSGATPVPFLLSAERTPSVR